MSAESIQLLLTVLGLLLAASTAALTWVGAELRGVKKDLREELKAIREWADGEIKSLRRRMHDVEGPMTQLETLVGIMREREDRAQREEETTPGALSQLAEELQELKRAVQAIKR